MLRRLLVLGLFAGLAVGIALIVLGGGDKVVGPAPKGLELPDVTPADPAAFSKPLGAAIALASAEVDPDYLRTWVERFTSTTPENELKWEVVHPRRADYDFRRSDLLVDAAEETGKRIRGHTLTWDIQLPGWLTNRTWTADEMEAVLREHVRTVVGRYKGRIAQWDVVNEPLEDDGSLTGSVFQKAMGERFIDVAFDEARKADPEAKLFLNEIATELPSTKQDGLFKLLKRLKARGVPVDGVGFQDHTQAGDGVTLGVLTDTFNRFAKLGLDIELTEVDVAVTADSAAQLRKQAADFGGAAKACATVDACTGMTVWGVTDRRSWLGEDVYPLLFRGDGEAKPAWSRVRAALGSASSG